MAELTVIDRPCCSPEGQQDCCDPAQKSTCCGRQHDEGSCGCRPKVDTTTIALEKS